MQRLNTSSKFSILVLTAVFASAGASASAFAADEKPLPKKGAAKAAKDAKKAADGKIAFDPAASVVKWEGKKVTGQHDGNVKIKSGEITMAGEELKSGEVVFDMTSITVNDLKDAEYNTKLVNHLKSDDFFNAEKFPTSTLKIKNAKSVPGFAGPTYEITADLTMKGKTNEVKFPAIVQTKDGKTTVTANVTVDRTKWDVKYGSGKFFKGLGDKMINDEFKVDVTLASK